MSKMSSPKENAKLRHKYIYNLPYPERRALTQLLDADGKWKDLGGYVMKVDQVELRLMSYALYRNESPTNLLLEKFGQRNGTIDELFIMLSKIEHYQAMQYIVQYVNPKYHHLLQRNGIYSSAANAIPSFSISPNVTYDNSLRNEGAFKMSSKEIQEAKFQDDPLNFESNDSALLLASKMSGLAVAANENNLISKPALERALNNILQDSQTQNGTSPTGVVGGNNQIYKPKQSAACCKVDSGEVKKLNIPVSPVLKPKKSKSVSLKSEVLAKSEELPQVMQILYSEICKATNNFEESRILGRGGFGIVYKGKWKEADVAIKRLLPKNKLTAGDTVSQQVSLKQSLTEMTILNSCRFDNILPLYGVCLTSPEPCIVYQYMINGSLEDRLLCKGGTLPLNWTQRAEIAEGTAKGLNFLHSLPNKPFVHGDIKSANILLDSEMKAKLGDFGLAREGPGSQYTHIKVSSVHGTQVYLPPEYLRHSQLSPKVDVYSYGIVLLEICTGLRAYNDKRPRNKLLIDYVADVIKNEGDRESLRDAKAGTEVIDWFDEMLKLGQKCSAVIKSKRPDMAEVLIVFQQATQAIIRTERIRKLSKQTTILPSNPQLSPLELQVWYDIHNGPNFMPLPKMANGQSIFRDDERMNGRTNANQLHPNFSASPSFPSFHLSDIMSPPSLIEQNESIFNQDSSCRATAGSEDRMDPVNSSMENVQMAAGCLSNNSDSLPCLTILGKKTVVSDDSKREMSELGPTPHPSGIISDSPIFQVDSFLDLDDFSK